MKQLIEDKEVIFHIAGANRADNFDLIKINTLGTMGLLEAIRKYSTINAPKIIFTSTLQIYGYSKKKKKYRETDGIEYSNIYAISKIYSEGLINKYAEDYGFKAINLRLGNVYGPKCKPFYNSVISTFIKLMLDNKTLTIIGSGESSRDYIYIKDVIECIIKSLLFNGSFPSTFNVCTGIPTSINDLINKLIILVNKKIDHIYKENHNADTHLIGSPEKTNKVLGFQSNTQLNEGLNETINWFKNK